MRGSFLNVGANISGMFHECYHAHWGVTKPFGDDLMSILSDPTTVLNSKWQYRAFIYYGNKLDSDSTADSDYTSLSEQYKQNQIESWDKRNTEGLD